jgi:hypothetical protein
MYRTPIKNQIIRYIAPNLYRFQKYILIPKRMQQHLTTTYRNYLVFLHDHTNKVIKIHMKSKIKSRHLENPERDHT